MNKKVLVFALVLVLAVTSIFAAKSDMKVGAQLGYGGRSFTESLNGDSMTCIGNGFYGAFTFEYGITDAVSVKAEAGINTMGHVKAKVNSGKTSDPSPYATPVNFAIFAGAMYNYEISKEITAYGGAGVDMMIGNITEEDDSSNTAIGLGLELGASYKINKQFSVNVGGKFGWHFINTNKDTNADNLKTTTLTYKAYAGVTYSL
jgi:opacity protein-like surface antigen